MKRALVAMVLAATAGVANADASANTTLYATPHGGSSVGQRVTFTASFIFACSDQVNTHYFVIDTAAYSSSFAYDDA